MSEKLERCEIFGNVYICGSPFVMSRTDVQNGLDVIFNKIHNTYSEDGKHFENWKKRKSVRYYSILLVF